MGYTHYWTPSSFSADDSTWNALMEFAKKLTAWCEDNGVVLRYEYYEADEPPCINEEMIRFNGYDEEGHETFLIHRDDQADFNFCKTARKPYDIAVVAMLFAMNALSPTFDWRSDGDSEDHAMGKQLFEFLN